MATVKPPITKHEHNLRFNPQHDFVFCTICGERWTKSTSIHYVSTAKPGEMYTYPGTWC